MKGQKEVLLIFKTHLDIGFTDLSKNVIDNYLTQFIPNAIKVGYELKDTETPFVWTVGSWMVWEALKHDADGIVEKAIVDGIICWHGLPFTTHTELMDTNLFEYGLSLSAKLDDRFGRKTVAAKMTDVPGHTIGMVSLMKKQGIEFLHIGVNPATPVPEVPPVFRWKCGEDEIVVMYQEDYGMSADFDDFAVCFAHTGDNLGPQSACEIIDIYDKLKQLYPECKIKAATLNDVAIKMRGLKNLPVIDKEIGDTWIHGAGTDPKKVAMYREVLRYVRENQITGVDFADNLLMVPEHTWGRDIKTYFSVKDYYHPREFEKIDRHKREAVENSWQEQRDYIKKAADVLGIDLKYEVEEPDCCKLKEISGNVDFEISWQLFDRGDYERYRQIYMRCDLDWAIWDFTKVGLPSYDGGIYNAKIVRAYTDGVKKFYRLEFDHDVAVEFGLPYFWVETYDSYVEIKWFGKRANRLPQAYWLKFKNLDENWELSKMGQWIKPCNIIGSPLISAVDKGIRNKDVEIESLDAVLIAPFGRRLLDFDLQPQKQNMYFNLYNNIWNTNFPMWYDEDAKFRFIFKKQIN